MTTDCDRESQKQLMLKVLGIVLFSFFCIYVPGRAVLQSERQLHSISSEYDEYRSSTQAQMDDLALRLQAASKMAVKNERTQAELKCLTDNVYYEAGTEPYEGKVAVATVTVNRMRNPAFPKSVCGVVYQHTETGCQFSWTCMDRVPKVMPAMYEEARKAAANVLLLGTRSPEAKEALYFHATYVEPNWNDDNIVARIGRHIFYKGGHK